MLQIVNAPTFPEAQPPDDLLLLQEMAVHISTAKCNEKADSESHYILIDHYGLLHHFFICGLLNTRLLKRVWKACVLINYDLITINHFYCIRHVLILSFVTTSSNNNSNENIR